MFKPRLHFSNMSQKMPVILHVQQIPFSVAPIFVGLLLLKFRSTVSELFMTKAIHKTATFL